MRRWCLALGLLSLFPFSPVPASAGCVSCGPGGECFDAAPGFSANCACLIRNRSGIVICTPKGVCDPAQPNSCPEDDPWTNVAPDQEISAKFVSRVAQVDPLLAGALLGAIAEEYSPTGESAKRGLVPGEHTGTMGKDGASYKYTVHAEQIAANAFSVIVLIEEDGTGRIEEFEGVILEKGRSGTLDRVGKSGRSRVIAWNARDGENAAPRSNR